MGMLFGGLFLNHEELGVSIPLGFYTLSVIYVSCQVVIKRVYNGKTFEPPLGILWGLLLFWILIEYDQTTWWIVSEGVWSLLWTIMTEVAAFGALVISAIVGAWIPLIILIGISVGGRKLWFSITDLEVKVQALAFFKPNTEKDYKAVVKLRPKLIFWGFVALLVLCYLFPANPISPLSQDLTFEDDFQGVLLVLSFFITGLLVLGLGFVWIRLVFADPVFQYKKGLFLEALREEAETNEYPHVLHSYLKSAADNGWLVGQPDALAQARAMCKFFVSNWTDGVEGEWKDYALAPKKAYKVLPGYEAGMDDLDLNQKQSIISYLFDGVPFDRALTDLQQREASTPKHGFETKSSQMKEWGTRLQRVYLIPVLGKAAKAIKWVTFPFWGWIKPTSRFLKKIGNAIVVFCSGVWLLKQTLDERCPKVEEYK